MLCYRIEFHNNMLLLTSLNLNTLNYVLGTDVNTANKRNFPSTSLVKHLHNSHWVVAADHETKAHSLFSQYTWIHTF